MTPPEIDYFALPLPEVIARLSEVPAEVERKFGGLSVEQLNWQPGAGCWSVAQVFEHLLVADGAYYPIVDAVLAGTYARSVWQRLPGWPEMWGKMMIKVLVPSATRKLKAPAAARPTASAINGEIVARFLADQRELIARLQLLADRQLETTIISSPFAKPITYSLLDAGRILIAHQHRHLAQAERVMRTAGFPASHYS